MKKKVGTATAKGGDSEKIAAKPRNLIDWHIAPFVTCTL